MCTHEFNKGQRSFNFARDVGYQNLIINSLRGTLDTYLRSDQSNERYNQVTEHLRIVLNMLLALSELLNAVHKHSLLFGLISSPSELVVLSNGSVIITGMHVPLSNPEYSIAYLLRYLAVSLSHKLDSVST